MSLGTKSILRATVTTCQHGERLRQSAGHCKPSLRHESPAPPQVRCARSLQAKRHVMQLTAGNRINQHGLPSLMACPPEPKCNPLLPTAADCKPIAICKQTQRTGPTIQEHLGPTMASLVLQHIAGMAPRSLNYAEPVYCACTKEAQWGEGRGPTNTPSMHHYPSNCAFQSPLSSRIARLPRRTIPRHESTRCASRRTMTKSKLISSRRFLS